MGDQAYLATLFPATLSLPLTQSACFLTLLFRYSHTLATDYSTLTVALAANSSRKAPGGAWDRKRNHLFPARHTSAPISAHGPP